MKFRIEIDRGSFVAVTKVTPKGLRFRHLETRMIKSTIDKYKGRTLYYGMEYEEYWMPIEGCFSEFDAKGTMIKVTDDYPGSKWIGSPNGRAWLEHWDGEPIKRIENRMS